MKICPVCNKKQKLIFTYSDFDYYKCLFCQIVSTHPYPTRKMIADHYREKFKKGNYELARKYANEYKSVYVDFVNSLKKQLQKENKTITGKSVLDIGCYTGEFLELLHNEKADVYGLELQSDAVKIANKKLPGRIFQSDISTDDFPSRKYDIVTLLGVIEHVPNPIHLLKQTAKVLKKNGSIMIQTPNSSSLPARLTGKYWPPYSPIEHIHLFSKKSLEIALKDCGFTNIYFYVNWKKLPIGYVYDNLNNFGPEFHKLLTPLNSFLQNSRLMLPFYGGEMIMMASKE